MGSLLRLMALACVCSVGLSHPAEDNNHPQMEIKDEEEKDTRTGTKHVDVMSVNEFLSLTGQMGTPGYIILICGVDNKQKNYCPEVTDLFTNLTIEYPFLEAQTVYYDLNEGDISIVEWFEIERIPFIMFIKDRRVFYYREANYTNYNVALFVKHFSHHPDYLYRSFPTAPRSTWTKMLEGLHRVLDRVYLLTRGNIWGIRVFYAAFVGIGLLFLYAFVMIGYEMLTGKLYDHMDKKEKQTKGKPESIDDLKVKRE